jgi:hypothetical protein
MQQTQTQNFHNPRLSTSSHSSLSAATSALLNGLVPSHRFSQSSNTAPTLAANLTPNQLKALQQGNNKFKRSEWIKQASIILSLTIILALLLIITIELTTKLVKNQSEEYLTKFTNRISNLNITNNETNSKEEEKYPIQAFFTCVWLFNGLLFIHCLIVHSIAIQRRSRRGRTTAVVIR